MVGDFLTGAVHLLGIFHTSKYLKRSCESASHFLTIANLENSDQIESQHIYEALQYRVKV